jgi:hypothetical protein
MREDEPQLLLRIGFGMALADVVEGAARNANLSTGVGDGHAVVHAVDESPARLVF